MKKIFTLIAMAVMACGVYAQTEISFAGLKSTDFEWDAAFYEYEANYTYEDGDGNSITVPGAFSYIGESQYSALQLKGKDVKFNYKNSSTKPGFFMLMAQYFTIGGKGVELILSNVKKGQLITLCVAAKDDNAAPVFEANAKLMEGDASTLTKKDNFGNLVYKVNTDGEVKIINSSNGYNIKSITIAEGSGDDVITDGTAVTITWPMSDPENITNTIDVANAVTGVAVSLGEGLAYAGTATFSDITFTKLQPTISDKGNNDYASATNLKKYIEFQVTPSAKYQITKVTFDVIKIGTGDPNIFVDLIDADGTAVTVGNNVTIRRNNDTDATSISQTFEASTTASDQPVALRIYVGKCANNKQVGIANVVITGTSSVSSGINAVKVAAENSAIYNLAGQKVGADFKGLVIKNGRKFIQK